VDRAEASTKVEAAARRFAETHPWGQMPADLPLQLVELAVDELWPELERLSLLLGVYKEEALTLAEELGHAEDLAEKLAGALQAIEASPGQATKTRLICTHALAHYHHVFTPRPHQRPEIRIAP
jgi:hypothetical protein